MKKFKFSLQTVHNIRETKRGQEQLKLADLRAKLEDASQQLEALENKRRETLDKYAAKLQSGEVDVFQMSLLTDYLKALANSENAARENVKMVQQACSNQRTTLAEAARNVEVTTKLHERQRAKFDLESARIEQNNLDEMVSINFARQLSQTK